jgi:hypothetical protein
MLTKLRSLAKSLAGKVLFVVVFVLVFLLVKEGKQIVVRENAMSNASAQASETMAGEIKNAQAQATQEKSATDVLAENSKKQLSATLEAANTEKKKIVVASNTFFGAYFMNTRTRPAYCSALGAPIPAFAKAYATHHRDLFVAAEKIQIQDFKENNHEYNIDKFYSLVSPATEKVVAQDMKDAAVALKISEREVCKSMEQDANLWVTEIDYKKQMPEVAQLLLKSGNTNR